MLAALALGSLLGFGAQAQAQPTPSARHHVIFLIDSSGTAYDSKPQLEDGLANHLGLLLKDQDKTGFDVDIYDPSKDYSSAMGFGLLKLKPFFGLDRGENGFLRVMWLQQPWAAAKLAERMPATRREYTAFATALSLAVPHLHAAMVTDQTPLIAFERTFLVLVTDGVRNASQDKLDEVRDIQGAARGDRVSDNLLKQDLNEVNALFRQFSNYYALRASPQPPPLLRAGSKFKVFVREVVPVTLDGLDALLAERPDKLTELKRRSHGRYRAPLSLVPDIGTRGESQERSYDLLKVEYRPPGSNKFERLSNFGASKIALPAVELERADIATADARYRITVRREDPVYGRSLQTLTSEPIRFSAEPTAQVLGLMPVYDWMMDLADDSSQDQIATLCAYVMVALFLGLLLEILYLLFFPRAVPAVKLHRLTAACTPIAVDFSRPTADVESAHPIVLDTLRFFNEASRVPRLLRRVFPRLRIWRAERQFDVHISTRIQVPEEVLLSKPAVGISVNMQPAMILSGLTHNSESTVGIRPDAFTDFKGDYSRPVECELEVLQRELRSGLFGRRRATGRVVRELRETFMLQFLPERSGLEARLTPTGKNFPTGETERALPDEPLCDWLISPHFKVDHASEDYRGNLFVLEIRSASRRVCSQTLRARISLLFYRADGTQILRNALTPDENATGGFVLEPDLGANKWVVGGIHHDPDNYWPIRIPLLLDFNQVPTPLIQGHDYVVEVQLHPAEGQDWPSMTARHGLRVGPDPRQADLVMEVATGTLAGSSVLAWHAVDSTHPTTELKIDELASWSVGAKQAFSKVLARIRVDNAARDDSGEIKLTLHDGITVELAENDDELEPTYRDNTSKSMLAIDVGGEQHRLCDLSVPLEWTITNDAPLFDRRVDIELRFLADGITSIAKELRTIAYRMVLPFSCHIRKTKDDLGKEHRFDVHICFTVLRHVGDYVLAIDFGTSAVVAAFESTQSNIDMRDDFSIATLDLQTQYHLDLDRRDNLDSSKSERAGEESAPNFERLTRFMTSHVVWRSNERDGHPDFLYLPATRSRLALEPGRAIHHLKALILRGDIDLPDLGVHYTKAASVWIDEDAREVQSRPPPVDGVFRSAYRGLMERYLLPILKAVGKDEQVDKLVFAHPNNFSLGHLDRLNRILETSFDARYRIDLLSESDAVACYCSHSSSRFMPSGKDAGRRTLLIYDIGAGTLDLTLSRLEWGGEEDASALQKMCVLFQSGIAVAGNRLDIALARVIDSKIRQLKQKLQAQNISINYSGSIVVSSEEQANGSFDESLYLARMAPVKRDIHQLKVQLAEHMGEGKQEFDFPLDASPDLAGQILSLTKTSNSEDSEQILKAHGVTRGESDRVLIRLAAAEIFAHPAVEAWLAQITDSMISDMRSALSEMGVPLHIDSLILSGRTSLFPPVRERLLKAITRELRIDPQKLHIPLLEPSERKEAVALGCLHYALSLRQGMQLEKRHVWAKYGVIYETGNGTRFKEFFGNTTAPSQELGDQIVEREKRPITLFSRTHTIHRSGGTIEIAATFSSDPDRDLQDPITRRDKFTNLCVLDSSVLGQAKRIILRLAINPRGGLDVTRDPDGLATRIEIAYLTQEQLPQLEWPHKPLKADPTDGFGQW